ncbi:MAG: hypothetical protein QM736_20460 [Vicinamibacterales bacterium]
MKKPRQVAAVQSCRGSHTHTLVPDPKDPANIYVYGSGHRTGPCRRGTGRLLGQGSERGRQHGALSAST